MAPKQGHKNRFTIVSSGRVNVLEMRLSRHPADSKKKLTIFATDEMPSLSWFLSDCSFLSDSEPSDERGVPVKRQLHVG
jgi:hypothetical protein